MTTIFHRSIASRAFAVAGLIFATACGSSSTGPAANGSAPMTAKIDGTAWSAPSASGSYGNGILAFAGANLQLGTIGVGVIASGPGTYAIGVGGPGNASVSIGGQAWSAAITGGSGSVTITSLTSTGAQGTFQFTAVPATGTGASGNKVVTEGTFDVTF